MHAHFSVNSRKFLPTALQHLPHLPSDKLFSLAQNLNFGRKHYWVKRATLRDCAFVKSTLRVIKNAFHLTHPRFRKRYNCLSPFDCDELFTRNNRCYVLSSSSLFDNYCRFLLRLYETRLAPSRSFRPIFSCQNFEKVLRASKIAPEISCYKYF